LEFFRNEYSSMAQARLAKHRAPFAIHDAREHVGGGNGRFAVKMEIHAKIKL